MNEREEDIVLINNILEGDSEAQKEFYTKYRTILRDYLTSKYPENYEIEDDISEILIKVFTNLYRYDEEKSAPKTWIFSIAKNYMIDKSRCNIPLTGTITINGDNITLGNGIITSDTTYFDLNGDNVFYTSSYTTDFENCDVLCQVSNSISLPDFTLLDMKYNQGFSYNEIGEEFNLSSNTVSNKVNYLKSKIKNCFAEELE